MKAQNEFETVPITTVIVTIFFTSPSVSVTEKEKKKYHTKFLGVVYRKRVLQ